MKSALIDIDTANALKRLKAAYPAIGMPELHFTCSKCGQQLAAHKDGQRMQGPHFEHIKGNPLNCQPKA